jgi:hypothetical protein
MDAVFNSFFSVFPFSLFMLINAAIFIFNFFYTVVEKYIVV